MDMTPELKEEMIQELSALVAIPSVTKDGSQKKKWPVN